MIANIFGTDGIIVLIVALVVLFGGSQLPKLAKNLGSAGREFRKAQQEAEEEAAAKATPPAPASVGPAPTPAVPATPPASPASDDDKLVISRNELRQELSNLMDQRPPQSGQ